MKKQKERVNQMTNYFREYISFIRKHDYIKQIVKNGEPKYVNQDEYFKKFNIYSYCQKVSVEVLPKSPDNINRLESKLIKDVGTIMSNYPNGSVHMNLNFQEEYKNGIKKYELRIYYAPKIPVYDFQINQNEELYITEESKKEQKSV